MFYVLASIYDDEGPGKIKATKALKNKKKSAGGKFLFFQGLFSIFQGENVIGGVLGGNILEYSVMEYSVFQNEWNAFKNKIGML